MTPEDRMKKLRSAHESVPTEDEWLAFRTRAHRSVARRRVAGVLGGAALLLAVVGGAYAVTNGPSDESDGVNVASSPTPSASGEPSPHTSPSSDPDAASADDLVYYQQWYVEDGLLLVWWEPFEESETPERDAVERLVFVPGPLQETGVSTALPPDTEILDFQITGNVAHVTLSGAAPDESDPQGRLASAQIVYTLTQFPDIEKVAIGWDSGDQGGTAETPATRKDYEETLPPISVEHPRAGETVERTFTMSGIANVYEANVSWRIVDQDGTVIDEGFTTATCGTGCWGTFEEEIEYTGTEDWAELQVFQSSAEDGSPMNMVTVPLNFEKAES